MSWTPTRESIEATNMWSLRHQVADRFGIALDDYPSFWRWSITQPGQFWDAVRAHAGIIGDDFADNALADSRMPGAVWYPGARLNFTENVMRHARGRADSLAILGLDEGGGVDSWSWGRLQDRVAAFSARLRTAGVGRRDVVAGVLPNTPETIVAMLATAAIGATWSVCAPDFAETAIVERLRQLRPRVLVGSSGYVFKGRTVETSRLQNSVQAALPTSRELITLDDLDSLPSAEPEYVRVPFDHPLWVLFSSGTTGAPKGIVHGHGGILLEAAKGIGLQFGLGLEDRYFTAANTSWMVWNTLPNTLSVGSAVVTFPGASTWPEPDRQFEIVAESGTTMLATGAAYLALVEKSGLRPGDRHDLSALHTIMSTGSVLSPSTWRWVHDAVKPDVHLSSDSGGTDICSGFVGGNQWQPVHVGELQGPALGVALEVRADDGSQVADGEVGELTVTAPMPSMPIGFWDDDDGALYRAAYFERDPSVWTHGDLISRTRSAGVIVHGRSDATLNRDGVRLGSAEIYAALDTIPVIRNSVVLGIERPDGGYWMPLFVELADGHVLDDELRTTIRTTIRARASARHVPDTIEHVPGIPVTHAGKRIEVPLKKLFLGRPVELAVNLGALSNPSTVDWFTRRARESRQNERPARE
ncbi:MAG TPA: acetoacetate--CoA ligase [Microbacterium sp.]|uniref:acetoacetate--CoA ligase n=1 Tax=Microbacterium sp. TaxID=51671 RepID=UPI002D0AADCA|nr:acetoacetate--CoA ligase [Microbacterium sp.]HWI31951.1 acetoacetate--CoA ligase [Microbacterium sp.]